MKQCIGNGNVRVYRRDLLTFACAGVLSLALPACAKQRGDHGIDAKLANLERQAGGRLGVGIVDLPTGEYTGHRVDERFGMCSTFKLALAAIILRESQDGRLDLNAPVYFTQDDMVFYAPITEQHLEQGHMRVVELAEATQKTSDNVAANLLLDLIGGPKGFTAKLREIGDDTSRLDRYEPEMNLVPDGEVRDTTTPGAMAVTVHNILFGSMLTPDNKDLLRGWMEDTRTGLNRLRAGFPGDWRAGDKTGTGIADGMANKYNDVAAVWPEEGRSGIVVTAFYEADGQYDQVREQDVAVLKTVGEIVAKR